MPSLRSGGRRGTRDPEARRSGEPYQAPRWSWSAEEEAALAPPCPLLPAPPPCRHEHCRRLSMGSRTTSKAWESKWTPHLWPRMATSLPPPPRAHPQMRRPPPYNASGSSLFCFGEGSGIYGRNPQWHVGPQRGDGA